MPGRVLSVGARAFDIVLLITASLVLSVVLTIASAALPAIVRRLEYGDFVARINAADADTAAASARFDAALAAGEASTASASARAAAAEALLGVAVRAVSRRNRATSSGLEAVVSRMQLGASGCAALPVLFAEVYAMAAGGGAQLVANHTHVCAVAAATAAPRSDEMWLLHRAGI